MPRAFRLGAPAVFTSDPVPLCLTPFAVDWTRVAEHCLDIRRILDPARCLTDPDEEMINVFEAHFVAAGMLACAENLVDTCRKRNYDDYVGELLCRSDILHVRPMREVVAQYGCVDSTTNCRCLRPADLEVKEIFVCLFVCGGGTV
jgi:hypothetical protein